MFKLTVSGLGPEAGAEVLITVAIEVLFMEKVGVRDGLEVAVTPLTVVTIHVSTVVNTSTQIMACLWYDMLQMQC